MAEVEAGNAAARRIRKCDLLVVPVGREGQVIEKDDYANPLPHVLMLTAIVVGVSTLGLALAISQRVYASFGTLEEDEILDKLRPGGHG